MNFLKRKIYKWRNEGFKLENMSTFFAFRMINGLGRKSVHYPFAVLFSPGPGKACPFLFPFQIVSAKNGRISQGPVSKRPAVCYWTWPSRNSGCFPLMAISTITMYKRLPEGIWCFFPCSIFPIVVLQLWTEFLAYMCSDCAAWFYLWQIWGWGPKHEKQGEHVFLCDIICFYVW